MKLKKIISIAVAMLVITCFAPAYAFAAGPPALPHAFYGTLKINDSDAPIGAVVEATGTGVVTGPDNPITTIEVGKYGGAGGLDPKLVVQGTIEDGAEIEFYVNGYKADQTAEWHSMTVEELPLTVTIPVVVVEEEVMPHPL